MMGEEGEMFEDKGGRLSGLYLYDDSRPGQERQNTAECHEQSNAGAARLLEEKERRARRADGDEGVKRQREE